LKLDPLDERYSSAVTQVVPEAVIQVVPEAVSKDVQAVGGMEFGYAPGRGDWLLAMTDISLNRCQTICIVSGIEVPDTVHQEGT
jgi:hypothetical protein